MKNETYIDLDFEAAIAKGKSSESEFFATGLLIIRIKSILPRQDNIPGL